MNEMMSSFGQQARKTQLIIVIRGNLNASVSVRASRDRLPNKTRQEARKGNRPYREMIERQVTPDLFKALVHSVVAQQISRAAADTVWSRLCRRLSDVTPRNVTSIEVSDIQKCGLSMRKA